jgi:hypothetical protein
VKSNADLPKRAVVHAATLDWQVSPMARVEPDSGIVGCCARAASGHVAAAPPSSVMNSRRLMRSPLLRLGAKRG